MEQKDKMCRKKEVQIISGKRENSEGREHVGTGENGKGDTTDRYIRQWGNKKEEDRAVA